MPAEDDESVDLHPCVQKVSKSIPQLYYLQFLHKSQNGIILPLTGFTGRAISSCLCRNQNQDSENGRAKCLLWCILQQSAAEQVSVFSFPLICSWNNIFRRAFCNPAHENKNKHFVKLVYCCVWQRSQPSGGGLQRRISNGHGLQRLCPASVLRWVGNKSGVSDEGSRRQHSGCAALWEETPGDHGQLWFKHLVRMKVMVGMMRFLSVTALDLIGCVFICRCWDLKTDTCVMALYGHTGSVNCLDVHADRLVSGAKDCLVKGKQPSKGCNHCSDLPHLQKCPFQHIYYQSHFPSNERAAPETGLLMYPDHVAQVNLSSQIWNMNWS